MKQHGFTIVEIAITLAVMAVLLTLGVASIFQMQANARDTERRNDIESIARSLEQRYKQGNSHNLTFYPKGTYPGTDELWDGPYYFNQFGFKEMLPGISENSLRSPSGIGIDSICIGWGYNERCSITDVENESALQAYFSDGSGSWKDMYLYEFISANNQFCFSLDCVRYNLYWISEVDKTVYKGIPGLKVYRSKHQ